MGFITALIVFLFKKTTVLYIMCHIPSKWLLSMAAAVWVEAAAVHHSPSTSVCQGEWCINTKVLRTKLMSNSTWNCEICWFIEILGTTTMWLSDLLKLAIQGNTSFHKNDRLDSSYISPGGSIIHYVFWSMNEMCFSI